MNRLSNNSLRDPTPEFFRIMVESVRDYAIFALDPDGHVASWNDGAARVKGWREEEVLGRYFSIFHTAEDNDAGKPEMELRVAREEGRYEEVGMRVRNDGSLYPARVSLAPMRDQDGRVIGFVKVIQNMTQQRQREAELERLHATLEQRVQERTHELEQAIVQLESFSYSISHDLRGPLRAMQGFASILIEDYASQLDDTGRHYLERISVAAQRMDRLVQDVLTLSRIQRASLPCVTVSLDRLVPELVDQHRQLHPDVARIRIDHPLLPVQAHEPSLIQCLTNLLTNAVKFARPGVPLEIHFSTELLKGDDLVRIRVRDNGVGIRREDQDRIFSIFEQVRNGNAASEGTGIGLAIVKAAVERMGGRVGVVSDFGKGSSFYVDLPPAEK